LNSISGSTTASLGPVHSYMTGTARADARGEMPSTVNTPTVAEATEAVNRAAHARGATDVAGLGSDYRRIALASGLNVEWKVEVMAWGTAVLRTAD
jgi:hypothetical protein